MISQHLRWCTGVEAPLAGGKHSMELDSHSEWKGKKKFFIGFFKLFFFNVHVYISILEIYIAQTFFFVPFTCVCCLLPKFEVLTVHVSPIVAVLAFLHGTDNKFSFTPSS